MNRLLALSFAALLGLAFTACPPMKKSCKDTGCGAGTTCNLTTGACEIPGLLGGGIGGGTTGGGTTGGGGGGTTGGGGGTTGGGGGGTTGGGGATGGGGMDAGFDAGIVIDPLDDGGVFIDGEICGHAIAVDFDGGTTATATVDLAAATDDYASSCSSGGTTGADLLFELNLAAETGLVVTATDATANQDQDLTVTLVSFPCPDFVEVSCVDTFSASEVLTLDRLPAGRWYVMVENYSGSDTPGQVDLLFELTPPVPAPPNDSCAMAQVLNVSTGSAQASGTTIGALNDNAAEPLTCSFNSANRPEVYFQFTITQEQNVTIDVAPATGSSLSPAVALLTDCAGGSANEVSCSISTVDPLRVRRLPAGTYFIVVDGNGVSSGAFDLSLTVTTPPPPPMNDLCTMPTTLVPASTQIVDVNTGALDYPLSCASGASGGDVVYTFTTPQAQRLTLTATGMNGADGVMALRGMPCDSNTAEVDCVDDAISGPEEISVLNLPAGTYFVILQAYDASAGEFGLALQLDPPVLPPMNDTCATPETLVPNMTQMVDLAGATADYSIDCDFYAGGDVVYTFTTTQPQRAVITATGTAAANAELEVRAGPCDTGMSLTCANATFSGAETVSLSNLPAGTYYVVLGSDGTDTAFGVQLTLDPPLTVTNDTCAMPEVITFPTGTTSVSRFIDTRLAQADYTYDISNTDCFDVPSGAEVVYAVTIPAMQTLTVTAVGQGYTDPVLLEVTPACVMMAANTCADDTFEGGTETLTVPNTTATAMNTFIIVKTYDSFTAGDMSLTFAVQ